MKRLLFFLVVLLISTWAAISYGQMYPSNPPLLGEHKPNAYGPGVSSDGTGRAFYWQPNTGRTFQGPDPTIQQEVNAYGFGSSRDQYGRRIEPQSPQEPREEAGTGSSWYFRLDP